MDEYRNEHNDKTVSFSTSSTYYYCTVDIVDELAKMDTTVSTRQISDALIDEICILLEQFHLN